MAATDMVTLDVAKDYLKIDGSTEDAILQRLITAATQIAEDFTGRAFVKRTITDERHIGDGAETIRVYKTPIDTLTTVKVNDVEITSYIDWSHVGRIKASEGWDEGAIVDITYDAGYGDDRAAVEALLPNLPMAILLIIADLYENRSDKGGTLNIAGVGSTTYNMPSRAEKILRPLCIEMFT